MFILNHACHAFKINFIGIWNLMLPFWVKGLRRYKHLVWMKFPLCAMRGPLHVVGLLVRKYSVKH